MKKIIHSKDAPKPIGAYSQAVRAGDFIFISGQIPLDPVTMEIIEGDIVSHIHQVFDNIEAIARAADSGLYDLVKLNVFLKDLGHFNKVNEVMAERLVEPYPARAAVEVSRLPKDVDVEIEAILFLSKS